jgi:hypothetical protein
MAGFWDIVGGAIMGAVLIIWTYVWMYDLVRDTPCGVSVLIIGISCLAAYVIYFQGAE